MRFQSINERSATIRPTPSPAHVGLAPPLPFGCEELVVVVVVVAGVERGGVAEEARCNLKSCAMAE